MAHPNPEPDRAQKPKLGIGRILFRVSVTAVILGILAVVVLTITSVRGIDARALDAEVAPVEDRSQRKPREGCGLNEVRGPSSCQPAAAASVREEEVKFTSRLASKGLTELKGTLSLPQVAAGEKRPAVVLIHGSGPQDRDELLPGDLVTKLKPPVPVFKLLAELFAKEGLVVLRYDKRACRRCYPQWTPDFTKFSFDDLEMDARDALAYLATRPEVDPQALVVAGHSEGGQLAPFVATGTPGVAAVIMLAGLTGTFDTSLIDQFSRIESIRLRQWDVLGALSIREQKSIYQKCFAKLAGPHDPADGCVGGGVNLGQLASFIAYEKQTLDKMRGLSCPLMVVQGTVDRNIDPAEIPRITDAMKGRDLEVHMIRGVAHTLLNALDPKRPPEIDQALRDRIRAFLTSVKR